MHTTTRATHIVLYTIHLALLVYEVSNQWTDYMKIRTFKYTNILSEPECKKRCRKRVPSKITKSARLRFPWTCSFRVLWYIIRLFMIFSFIRVVEQTHIVQKPFRDALDWCIGNVLLYIMVARPYGNLCVHLWRSHKNHGSDTWPLHIMYYALTLKHIMMNAYEIIKI